MKEESRRNLRPLISRPRLRGLLFVLPCLILVFAGSCKPEHKKGVEQLGEVARELEEFRQTAQSISKTPPSTIFPAMPIERFPRVVTGARVSEIQGFTVSTIELRGWIVSDMPDHNNDDEDFRWNIEIDPASTDALGLKLSDLYKVGNLWVRFEIAPPADGKFDRLAETPALHVEAAGLTTMPDEKRVNVEGPPPDWIEADVAGRDPGDVGFDPARDGNGNPVKYAFNPHRPLSWQEKLRTGDYVRIVGSLITDYPHIRDYPPRQIPSDRATREEQYLNDVKRGWGDSIWADGRFARENGEVKWVAGGWLGGFDGNSGQHPAAWTEMHPVDIIAILDPKQQVETVRGVAVLAEPKDSQVLEVEIAPPQTSRPPNSEGIGFIEEVGPDSAAGTFTNQVTVLEDKIRVRVEVIGSLLPPPPRFGKFWAIYRVFWKCPGTVSGRC